MLKHVVAHRSNSSLGGGGGVPSSCLSPVPPGGPSSLGCLTSTSSLPPRRSSLSACESRTRTSLSSPFEARTRSSLCSSTRPVYRRADTYTQPFGSLKVFQEGQVLSNRSLPLEPAQSATMEDSSLKKAGDNNVPEVNSEVALSPNGYTPVYPTRFGHNRDAYYDYLRRLTAKTNMKEDEGSTAVEGCKTHHDQSYVDKINEQDSYPSLTNQFEEEFSSPTTYRHRSASTGSPSISVLQERFPLEKTETLSEEVEPRSPNPCYRKNLGPSSLTSPISGNGMVSGTNQINSPNAPVRVVPNLRPSYKAQQMEAFHGYSSQKQVLNTSFDGSVRSLPFSLPKGTPPPGVMSMSMPVPFDSSCPSSATPRSSTLPRREFKEELRRGSIRSNASSCSLLSSISCSSLANHSRVMSSRASSTSSLSETIPVKVYLRRLRPDMEYKTVSLSSQTTCRELIVSLLTKFRLRHRDPNLFFILMEVTVRSPSDDAPVKRLLVLDDNARPAELQQCRPKGEARFSVGVRRGGLVRVHDSILMPGSQYKSLMVAYNTNSDELVQLMLKCYNSTENPMNYALHELCKNPYSDRQLAPDECPLMVQSDWPRNNRANWAFILRRNLAYAFSLKSRMSWRRSLDQSSTDTESEFDDPSTSSGISYSNQQSRSSSISSTSSVSSACSSSSSENSLDSGYLGSPLSGCKVPSNSPTYNRFHRISSDHLRISSKSVIPITANVSKMSLNASLASVSGTPDPVKFSTPQSTEPKPKTNTNSSGRLTPLSLLTRRHLRPLVPQQSPKVPNQSTNACIKAGSSPSQEPSTTSTNNAKLQSTSINSQVSTTSASSAIQKSSTSSFQPYTPKSKPQSSQPLAQTSTSSATFQEPEKTVTHPSKTSSSPPSEPFSANCSGSASKSSPKVAEQKFMDAIESLRTLSDVQSTENKQ